jgi:hypothetical protein
MVIARSSSGRPLVGRYLPTNPGADGPNEAVSSSRPPVEGYERAHKESPLIGFGACFWAHGATWPEMRDAALAAEAAGFDSVWTDDHLVNDMGDPRIPVFEAWTTLAAWAVMTSRPRSGCSSGPLPFETPDSSPNRRSRPNTSAAGASRWA